MKELSYFNFENKTCRTIKTENQFWWVGKDICKILGYKDIVNAIKTHCRGVAKYHPIIDRLGTTKIARIIQRSPSTVRRALNKGGTR